nr:involucrin-like [Quercus suber]
MASFKDLMKNRNKKVRAKETSTSQPAVNLPPPPSQIPSDFGLKPLPDPKKKRPITDNEEREVVPPKRAKQQKVDKSQRSKRVLSTESRDKALVAEITQQVSVAEEWNKKTFNEAQAEAHTRFEVEKSLGSLKEDYSRLFEQLRDMTSQRDNLDVGLKTTEKQAENQRKQLRMTEINLETQRESDKGLHAELQKAKEAAQLAKKDAQLAKEAVEAERQAAYTLGVCREYCDVTWDKALETAGVPLDADLRQPKSVFYHPDICELPEASEQPVVDQTLPDPAKAPKESGQAGNQGKQVEGPQDGSQDLEKRKTPLESKDQTADAATQPSQTADPLAPQKKT